MRIVELTALKNAAQAQVEAETALEVAEKFKGQLLSMNERRAIAADIARNCEDQSTRLTAIMHDAKLAGELVEKVESSIDDKRTLTAEQAAQRLAQVQAERLLRVLPKAG